MHLLFNGIDLEPYFRIKDIRGRGLIQRQINSILVPGMDGEYPTSIETPAKILEIDIRIVSDNLRKAVDDLNSILATDDPVPIIFPDEPNMTYYGTVETSEETGERVHLGRHDTTIYIRRSDPHKYGPEKPFSFETDYFNIENKGTAEAEPIFELEVKEPITFAMLQNQFDEYNMIGRPIDVTDTTPFQKYERVFYSNASNDEGWTNANSGEIDGIVSGTMRTNGTRFQASSYGTGSGWHGPAIKTSLPEVLTDFRVETFVSFYNKNVAGYVGRVEIYLLDELGNSVAKLAIKDTQNGQALSVGESRLGDTTVNHYMIDEQNAYWNNFFGILRIEREGNEWRAYIAMVDSASGRHHTRRSVRWIDTENQFTRKVAQVVIHMGKFGNHQTTTGGFYSVSAYKINQEPEGIPYIADVGDIITFDHTNNGQIYINGEPYEDTNLGSDYFTLKKGDNNIVALPDNAFGISGRYRERYL